MSESDIIYAAGFFDGEGCVSITCKNRFNNVPESYLLQVVLTNTNYEVMLWWLGIFPGSFYKQERSNASHKPRYMWRLVSDKAVAFLQSLLPYLKVKSEVANNAIQFQYAKNSRLSKELQHEFYVRSHYLNRLGVGEDARPTKFVTGVKEISL